MTKYNTPTLSDAAMAAMRLNGAGMALKHAVSLASGSFGFSTDEIYKELARLQNK
jgi:hypothetical protein